MKAYDTRWAAHLIAPYLRPNGLMAGVQNGMTTSTVAEVVGAERTMGAVIEITSALMVPGIVERHSGPGRSWFAVGGIDAATRGREEEIASLLQHSGTVEIVERRGGGLGEGGRCVGGWAGREEASGASG